MKKILALTLLLLSFAVSAFSANSTVTGLVTAGAAIYGGADATTAGNATNALARFSTNVVGVINESADVAAKTAVSYALITKHTSGSKMFGTSNDATNIYWKALAGGTVLTSALAGTAPDATNFSVVGSGWTSY